MEKLLAMSLISAPMDFSGPSWVRARMASVRSTITGTPTPAAEEKKDGAGPSGQHRGTSGGNSYGAGEEKHVDGSRRARPHFAPEFDGLHCFETFVIH